MNLMLIGDGKGKTVITGGTSVADHVTTFHTASFAATGAGFIARDMTFENYAGPEKHQAVALRVGADHSVIYRCNIIGYQDTLYVHSQRQFYRDCDIYGTVDFIFGNAAVVIQNCNIYARKPMAQQKVTITAQNRKDPNQNTGISIHSCKLLAQPDLLASNGSFQTFLGRPWKMYSRTVYLLSYMGDHIDPKGWLEWDGTFALDTLYYGEYMNYGPGGAIGRRVKWPGYRVITSAIEAGRFTVAKFIYGSSWLPSTGVAFLAGLSE
uniref:Pectinesterase n=1 Tax=Tanacetum cinerariifolium TaxID=118510 RepID=A0A699L1H7_TANCI|nr:probable pectinesterase/pectinesterase inhibitor 61 [Tanacetum cinerariifolium]